MQAEERVDPTRWWHGSEEAHAVGGGFWGMAPEVKRLSDSGCIKVSAIMDSGTAESVAQIGVSASLIGELRDRLWWLSTTVAHSSLSHGTNRMLPLPPPSPPSPSLHCRARREQISGFQCGVVLLGHGCPARLCRARVPRSHGQCARQSDTPEHGKRASLGRALAETQHGLAQRV